MRTVVPICFALFAGVAPATPAFAQTSPYVSVLGVVEKVDDAGKVISVKPAKGDPTTVKFDERTTFLKMPAGETDTKKAAPATASDVTAGDSVIARVLTADPTGKPARTVYIEKQADLAQRREKTQEEWKTATSGLISSIDGNTIKIMGRVPGSPAPKEITVEVGAKVDITRYNPENGKYEPSTLASVKTGDQLRVLGEKSADSTQIKATDIGAGTFKTMGVVVKTVDTAGNLVTGTDAGTKQPVTVHIRPDSALRRFNDMSAMMVARQLNPTYQQAGGRGGRGGGGGAQGGGAPGGGAPPGGGASAAAGGGGGRGFGGGGRGRGGMDVSKIIEQQPTITLADLKPGESVIISAALGSDPSKIFAIGLVAGADPILRATANSGPDPLAGSWNMGGGGGGEP
jgi:hypothetical protein